MSKKEIRWIGSSQKDLRDFPDKARRKAGFELFAIQRGEKPKDFKPMDTIGKGVEEIRISTGEGAYRILYIARFEEAIYVLHAFQKKTQKTSKKDINIGCQRYKAIMELRKKLQES